MCLYFYKFTIFYLFYFLDFKIIFAETFFEITLGFSWGFSVAKPRRGYGKGTGELPYGVSKEAAGMGMLPLPAVNWLVRCFKNFGLGTISLRSSSMLRVSSCRRFLNQSFPWMKRSWRWDVDGRIDDVRPPMYRASRAQVSLCPRPYNVRAFLTGQGLSSLRPGITIYIALYKEGAIRPEDDTLCQRTYRVQAVDATGAGIPSRAFPLPAPHRA